MLVSSHQQRLPGPLGGLVPGQSGGNSNSNPSIPSVGQVPVIGPAMQSGLDATMGGRKRRQLVEADENDPNGGVAAGIGLPPIGGLLGSIL